MKERDMMNYIYIMLIVGRIYGERDRQYSSITFEIWCLASQFWRKCTARPGVVLPWPVQTTPSFGRNESLLQAIWRCWLYRSLGISQMTRQRRFSLSATSPSKWCWSVESSIKGESLKAIGVYCAYHERAGRWKQSPENMDCVKRDSSPAHA